jgi:hypothetical protein
MKTFLLSLLVILLTSCSEHGMTVGSDAKRTTLETGGKFAGALVDGKYAEARMMLTKGLQQMYSPEDLASRYKGMIAYGGGPAKLDGYTSFIDHWPARQPKDYGCAYVSISGLGYVEAVTVIVIDENGSPKIRDIEWGRP